MLIGGVFIWSVTTFACGMASTYVQLLVARMGVGTGEASVTPAAWSMLADYFPPDKLARPVSVFLMGPYLGGGLALIGGAYVLDWAASMGQVSIPVIGEVATWQLTFMAVAIPGILIVALLATLRDPARRHASTEAATTPPWRDVFRFLKSEARIYLAVLVGVPFVIVILYGLQGWVPTILLRVYGWDLADAGRIYGTVALVAGSAGVLCGPFLGKWLQQRGYEDYPLRVGVIGAIGIMLSICSLPWQTTGTAALVCIGLASFFVTLPLALMTLVLQIVTPNEMRGVVAGIFVVNANVLGLGLGPTLVATTTDYVLADPGRVHISLTAVSMTMAPIAMVLIMSGMRAMNDWGVRQNASTT